MRNIVLEEGSPFKVDEILQAPLRVACRRVQAQLLTSFPVLEEAAGLFTIRGVVGTISVTPAVVLDVAPKVEVGDNWIAAVLDLLIPPDRIEVAGDRRSGLAPHRDLLEVLATVFSERLERALRRDGPIQVMERREATLPLLKGKLQIGRWARNAAWAPHHFPVAFQELTTDNDYSRTLAFVALLLSRSRTSPRVRSTLLECARGLRPGAPEVTNVDTHLALRRLPPQWAAYEPAWDIAVSVLSRRSLLGSVGTRFGVSVAVEPWPLLERLLERALDQSVRLARLSQRNLVRVPKQRTTILDAPSVGGQRRGVIPDGQLVEDGATVATFEAKYATRGPRWPSEDHVFQTLTTASACGSPLAVLVYPEEFDAVWWNVLGFDDHPKWLAAVGLGLFSYRRGSGDRHRAEMLLDVLSGRPTGESPAPTVGG
jgi:hypothetical protein